MCHTCPIRHTCNKCRFIRVLYVTYVTSAGYKCPICHICNKCRSGRIIHTQQSVCGRWGLEMNEDDYSKGPVGLCKCLPWEFSSQAEPLSFSMCWMDIRKSGTSGHNRWPNLTVTIPLLYFLQRAMRHQASIAFSSMCPDILFLRAHSILKSCAWQTSPLR